MSPLGTWEGISQETPWGLSSRGLSGHLPCEWRGADGEGESACRVVRLRGVHRGSLGAVW